MARDKWRFLTKSICIRAGRLHAGPLAQCIGHHCAWHPIRADKISWHLILAIAVWRQVPNGPLQSDTESMKEKQKMSDRGNIDRNKNLITFERQHASDEIFMGKKPINKQREKSPNSQCNDLVPNVPINLRLIRVWWAMVFLSCCHAQWRIINKTISPMKLIDRNPLVAVDTILSLSSIWHHFTS